MGIGNIMNGAIDGYYKAQEDRRLQASEARLQNEQSRIDKQRSLDDELNAATALYIQKQQKPMQPTPQVATVLGNGITGTGATSPAEANTPAATGIGSAQTPFNPSEDHLIALAKFRSDWRLNKGDYNGALEEHKNAMAFAADKLKKEDAVRNRVVDATIGGIARGDYSGVSQVYAMIPDGNKLAGIGKNKDGTITMKIVDNDGNPLPDATFKNDEHLANTIKSVSDPKTILTYWDTEFKRMIDLKKANSEAAKTVENTTAEIKNISYLLNNGIAKNQKEAWEMVRTGKTPGGDKVISDGVGGVIVTDPEGTITKYDSRGKAKVIKGAAGQPGAVRDLSKYMTK